MPGCTVRWADRGELYIGDGVAGQQADAWPLPAFAFLCCRDFVAVAFHERREGQVGDLSFAADELLPGFYDPGMCLAFGGKYLGFTLPFDAELCLVV